MDPFATEILIQIFRNLDIITATSFHLVCHKFQDIYLKYYLEHLPQDWWPLKLETKIWYEDGTSQTLKGCLESWMPPHLVYNNWPQRFVPRETLLKISEIVQEDCAGIHRAKEDMCKAQNETKRELIDDGQAFDEMLGLNEEYLDIEWELQRIGAERMDLDSEGDSKV